MNKLLFFLTVLFFIPLGLMAQNKTITGKVVDESGAPVIGANVITKGSKTGTQTNKTGDFSINASGTGSIDLVISSVGYESKILAVTGTDAGTVQLTRAIITQEDVVVVGYATVKRKDLTGSVSSVNAKELKDIPLSSAAEALTGRLAGVQVTTSEGGPGANVVIRVRGGGSITQDNNPIYIVDGIQVEDALNTISPQDIATVDVLKDASTTAIYGARGANGVVLITTKNGKAGKTKVSYNGSFGTRKIFKKLDVLQPYDFVRFQYERSMLQNDTATFKRIYGTTWDTLENYKSAQFIDWQDKVFGRSANYQNHNVSVSGGNQATTFNLSLTANKEDGVQLESAFQRYLAAFKLDHKVSDKFRIGFNTRFLDQVINGAGTTGSGTRTTNRLRHSIQYRPFELAVAAPSTDFDEEYYILSSGISNPVLLTQQEYRRQKSTAFNLSGYASYEIIKNLTFRTTLGYDINTNDQNLFWGEVTGTARNYNSQPVARVSGTNYRTLNISNTLQYSLKGIRKNHNVDVLVGQEIYQRKYTNNTTEVRFLPIGITAEKAFARLALGSPPSGSTFQQPNPTSYVSAPDRILSFFGRVNYAFKDKYLATVSVRSDRSSKFSYDNGNLIFPSGSVAWRFSKEKFMKNIGFISDGKLRVGYGAAGNNRIADFLYLQLYNTNGQFALNHVVVPGYEPEALANSTLKWEKTLSTNIGLDLAFLNNRIQFTVDAYQNKGEDLLLGVAIPPTSGYTSQIQNVGATRNRGLEFQISATPIDKKNFQWNTNFNMSLNRNKVVSLGPVTQLERSAGWQGSDGTNDYLVKVGEPVGLMYGFVTDGWYQIEDFDYNATTGAYTLKAGVPNATFITGPVRPGTMKVKDLNGDGIISVDGDRQVLGNAQPKFTGGWSNQFTYKNFDLSVFMNFVVGNKIYNANKIEWTEAFYPNLNVLNEMKDRWTNIDAQGNRVTDPTALAALNVNAKIWSPNISNRFYLIDYAIEDGSFLRVNNLTLGYTLPKSLTAKAKISSVRVFATVNNLATITSYSGYDPEVTTRLSDPLTPGVDFAAYPKTRTWVFGANINF